MLIKITDRENLFFTSDNHFNHAKVIDFCSRPYNDVNEMNQSMIDNWNKIVPKNGIVFHAGDFMMSSNIFWIKNIVSKLNGHIYLSLGNHDMGNKLYRTTFKDVFCEIDHMFYVNVNDERLDRHHINFLICHYPLFSWRSNYYHLHGHCHSSPNEQKIPYHPMRYDIGVDNNDYSPISYNDLLFKFKLL